MKHHHGPYSQRIGRQEIFYPHRKVNMQARTDTMTMTYGFRAVAVAPKGEYLFGGLRTYESPVWPTRAEAEWFLKKIVEGNKQAYRTVIEARIDEGTWPVLPPMFPKK